MNYNKMKLKELENLYYQKVSEGYVINPELNFRGIKGRITKDHYIWGLNNLVKKDLVVSE